MLDPGWEASDGSVFDIKWSRDWVQVEIGDEERPPPASFMRGLEFLLRNYTRVIPVDPNHAGPGERHRCLCAYATYKCLRGSGEFVQRHAENVGMISVCQCFNAPLETPYTVQGECA